MARRTRLRSVPAGVQERLRQPQGLRRARCQKHRRPGDPQRAARVQALHLRGLGYDQLTGDVA